MNIDILLYEDHQDINLMPNQMEIFLFPKNYDEEPDTYGFSFCQSAGIWLGTAPDGGDLESGMRPEEVIKRIVSYLRYDGLYAVWFLSGHFNRFEALLYKAGISHQFVESKEVR